MTFELRSKVLEGIEHSLAVKAFLIFSVAPFHLAVVSGGVWFDTLVLDSEPLQSLLKQRQMRVVVATIVGGEL